MADRKLSPFQNESNEVCRYTIYMCVMVVDPNKNYVHSPTLTFQISKRLINVPSSA